MKMQQMLSKVICSCCGQFIYVTSATIWLVLGTAELIISYVNPIKMAKK
jgi:hypothetical protein